MNLFTHSALFLLALGVVWALSGFLIEAINRVARRYNKPGFAVAFFVLGFLTSIGEMSVAFNSSLEGVPQVSAGNLVGASIVIFLLIIPLLAVIGRSIDLHHALRRSNMLISLCIIAAPSVFCLDGDVSAAEGLMMLLSYAVLIYRLRKRKPLEETVEAAVEQLEKELVRKRRYTILDVLYIVIGAVIIFIAGNVLVGESVYFTSLMGAPASVAGLLILSIGTNVPEIVIGVRSVMNRHTDIAFGDYVGSAAANTVLFGLLAIGNGRFPVAQGEFIGSFLMLGIGLALFAVFSKSKNDISRKEGAWLLIVYACFVAYQIGAVAAG